MPTSRADARQPDPPGLDRRSSQPSRPSSSGGCSASSSCSSSAPACSSPWSSAWLVVLVRRPRLEVGPVDPSVGAHRRRRRPRRPAHRAPSARCARRSFELVEPVGPSRTARMAVAPLPADAEVTAGYRIPTERRGVLTIGPLDRRAPRPARARPLREPGRRRGRGARRRRAPTCSTCRRSARACSAATCWRWPSGSARATSTACASTSTATSRASIHWKASARSETLKVRQHAVEGLRRCLVVLDRTTTRRRRRRARPSNGPSRSPPASSTAPTGRADDPLRHRRRRRPPRSRRGRADAPPAGPHRISTEPTVAVERDPGEGLGLVVAIGTSPAASPCTALERVADPTLTAIGVYTMQLPARHAGCSPSTLAPRPPSSTPGRRWPAPAATSRGPGAGVTRRWPRRSRHDRRGHRAARPAHSSSTSPATLGLALYSLVAALGFVRVFGGWQFLGDVFLIVARRPRSLVPAAPHAAARARRRAAHGRRRRLDDRLAGLPDDVLGDLPDARDVGHHAGPTCRSSAISSRSPSRRSSTSAAGRCWPRSAPPSSCCLGRLRLPGPRPRRGARARRGAVRLRRRARRRPSPGRAWRWRSSAPASSPRPCCGCGSPRRRAPSLGRARSPLSITIPAAVGAGAVVVLGAWVIGPRLPGRRCRGAFRHAATQRRGHGGPQPARRHPLPPRQPRRHRAVRGHRRRRVVLAGDGLPEFDGRTWSLPDRSLDGRRRRLCPRPHRARRRTPRRSSSAPSRASSCPAPPNRSAASGDGLRWTAETSTLVRADRDFDEGDASTSSRRRRASPPRRCGRQRRRTRPTRSTSTLPDDFPPSVSDGGRRRSRPARRRLRRHARSAELVPDAVRVQPRRAARPRQRRHRGLPAPAGRVLRAVRRHVRRDGPLARHPGPRRRRLHARHRAAGRHPRRVRQERPRLAGGVVRRARVGAVRADAGPRRTRSRGLHRAARRPGRLDPATRRRVRAATPRQPRARCRRSR